MLVGLSKNPWKYSLCPKCFSQLQCACAPQKVARRWAVPQWCPGETGRAGGMKCKSSPSFLSGRLPAVYRGTAQMRAWPCSKGCSWDCCREIPNAGPWEPLALQGKHTVLPACGVNRYNGQSPFRNGLGGVSSPCVKEAPVGA